MWEPGSAEGTQEHGQWKVTAVSTGPLGGKGGVGGARHQTMNGVGGVGAPEDTHVRGVPRPPSGGDDNVVGRKQSLRRNRESHSHPGHLWSPLEGSTSFPITASALKCGPCGSSPRDWQESL